MMKRLFSSTAIVLALASSTQAGVMQNYARAGVWIASHGLNDSHVAMCTMQTPVANGWLFIKWQRGNAAPFLHFSKPTWRVPYGTAMPIEIQFDGKAPYAGEAHGRAGNGISMNIRENISQEFIQRFIDGDWLTVRFPGGTEQPWIADLTGSERIARHFMACVSRIQHSNPTTQPHQGGGGTRPHQGGGTQPHGGV